MQPQRRAAKGILKSKGRQRVFPFNFFCDKFELVLIIIKDNRMASYRDDLRDLASKLDYMSKDLDNYVRTINNLAEKVKELEEENKRLAAGK